MNRPDSDTVEKGSWSSRDLRVFKRAHGTEAEPDPQESLEEYSGWTMEGTVISTPFYRAGFWGTFHSGLGSKGVNDPSAGSPTETLLRLLLPLNDKV